MKKRIGGMIVCSIGLLLAAVRPICAQDAAKPPAQDVSLGAGADVAKAAPGDIQWIWGEVISIDAAAQTLNIKYLDYDTDEEKTMVMTVTDTTKFQGDKGLAGIKPQDTISVEYIIQDGKNCAKDITVEQIADTDTANDQPQAAAPEKVGTGPVTEVTGPAAPSDQPQDPQQDKGQ